MDNPENTEGVNHRWTIQRIPKGSITDGQSMRNWQHTVHKTKKKNHKTVCVEHHHM
jgi:hypothetical protein